MQRRSVNRRLLAIMFIGLALVTANYIGALRPLSTVLNVAARPFQGGLSGAGQALAGWTSVVSSAGTLESQNQQLKSQIAALHQQASANTELKAQNNELRRQLGVGEVQPDRLIAAEVIAYQPDNFRQFLTIGRGSRDGIKAGMAVVEQGTLVGTIQDVGPTTSKVFLSIDPNFRVAALDQDVESRPSGTIHGQIGNGLVMDKIAQTEIIHPGDTIVTSGLGGSVEKGLIVGRVQTINKQDNGVFQTAQVTTDVQFDRLEIVYVVARPQ